MKKQRVLSIILSVALLLSFFSSKVHASDETVTPTTSKKLPNESIISETLEDYKVENIWPFENALSVSEQIDSLIISPTITFSTNMTSSDIVSSIKEGPDIIIEGKVIDGVKEFDINEYYDFSSTSRYHVAQWAYSADLISEVEKIDCFCDLILSRNFDNIDCLEGVFDAIQQYQLNNVLSNELNEKINEILSVPFDSEESTASTRSISNEAKYSTSNFTIHYDSGRTTLSAAKSVADYFEQIRTTYLNLGFSTPILEPFNSKYHVYLDPDSDPNGKAAATTTKFITLTNVCASHITIYNFNSLTTGVQERIAHEYFHAIQNAYNHQSSWFKEACANWGKIIAGGSSTTCNWQINSFIGGTTPLPETDGYGAVMFPLTIHLKYGGANAILSIYEVYNDYSAFISQSQLRDVISLGINNTGAAEGFKVAYRYMASYLYNPKYWYSSIHSGASAWVGATKTILAISDSSTTVSNPSTSTSGSLTYLTNKYYKLSLPTSFEGAVRIDVDYDDSNGQVQIYTETSANQHSVKYLSTDSNGDTTFVQTGVGSSITSVGIILTNLAESSSINFNVKVTLLPSESSLLFSQSSRYMERCGYIAAGRYMEYKTTFANGGNKVFQTFGTKDTQIYLYDEDGVLLASNDDSGYNLNAFLSYNVSQDTVYTIKVKFYSSSQSGDVKLAIMPTATYSTYESTLSCTTNCGASMRALALNNVDLLRYTVPSAMTVTFTMDATYDTYLYIIDPRSTAPISSSAIQPSTYNDDGGGNLQAKITKTLDANVPYLVIISAFNPATQSGVYRLYFGY